MGGGWALLKEDEANQILTSQEVGNTEKIDGTEVYDL